MSLKVKLLNIQLQVHIYSLILIEEKKMMPSFLKCRHCFHSIVSRLDDHFYTQKRSQQHVAHDMLGRVSIFHEFLLHCSIYEGHIT